MKVLKEFYQDELHVRVFETRTDMGACAGADVARCIKKLQSEQESINVMFAAAPSQNETLAALVADSDIDWTRVNAFHMDEYVGLDPKHPAGFRNYLYREIFGKKPFRTVNILNGNANNPEEEAKRYSRLLIEHPLDVCILGVGENGHIAFNDPPVADFCDPVLVKTVKLEEQCRQQQVHDGCFDWLDQVPMYALSVTIPGLMAAKYMFCSVPSDTKANAIDHLIHDEISVACPATILRKHEGAELYLDVDSAKFILKRENLE